MARAAAEQTRRRPAPPPAEDAPSVYDEIWGAITENDPKFGGPGNKSDQNYFKRMLKAINDIPEAQWDELSEAAKDWYDTAVTATSAGEEIEPPPGYGEEATEEAEEAEEEAEEEKPRRKRAATPEPAPAKHKGAEALRKFNENRRAEKAKAAKAAAADEDEQDEAEEVEEEEKPRKRGAAAPAPAKKKAEPVQRRAATQKKASAKASNGAGEKSMAMALREYVIDNLDCTYDELQGFCTDNGYDAQRSTIAGIMTFTKQTVLAVKALGHWKDVRK